MKFHLQQSTTASIRIGIDRASLGLTFVNVIFSSRFRSSVCFPNPPSRVPTENGSLMNLRLPKKRTDNRLSKHAIRNSK